MPRRRRPRLQHPSSAQDPPASVSWEDDGVEQEAQVQVGYFYTEETARMMIGRNTSTQQQQQQQIPTATSTSSQSQAQYHHSHSIQLPPHHHNNIGARSTRGRSRSRSRGRHGSSRSRSSGSGSHSRSTLVPAHHTSSLLHQLFSASSGTASGDIYNAATGETRSYASTDSTDSASALTSSLTSLSAAYQSDLVSRVGTRALAMARASGGLRDNTGGGSRRSSHNRVSTEGERRKNSRERRRSRSIPKSSISPPPAARGSDDYMCTVVPDDFSSESSSKATNHMPQNLRGDPFRSAKVKTELCRNFMRGKGCIFGDKCNYAHGEHELKYTTLLDLERAGLVDINNFRTHPCPTWVATGSCPFDLRCPFLHDQRVSSSHSSWLPHAEIAVNSIDTDVNVDKLYHENTGVVYRSTPLHDFAASRKWFHRHVEGVDTLTAWRELYAHVCNIDVRLLFDLTGGTTGDDSSFRFYNRRRRVSELHRIVIASVMRQLRLGTSYIYHPTHVIFGELCMILQSRAFRIVPGNPSSMDWDVANLRELAIPDMYWGTVESDEPTSVFDNDLENNIVVAHEVAFGPIGDPNSKPLSICFNIPTSEMSKCTPQQAKRHKRTRNRTQKAMQRERNMSPTFSSTSTSGEFFIGSSDEGVRDYESSDTPPFYENQPLDVNAFDLVSDILKHRAQVLMTKTVPGLLDLEKKISRDDKILRFRFENQFRFWATWAWPLTLGRDQVDESTQVPPVGGIYSFKIEPLRQQSIQYAKLATGFIWLSFVLNFTNDRKLLFDTEAEEYMPSHSADFTSVRRLSVLRSLSLGKVQRSEIFSMPRLAREQATEFQAVEGENDFIRHKVSSFRSLFDFFSIVQNHYSLRNTAVDEKGESGGSSSDSSPVQKFAAVVLDGSNVEPPIQEAALSWNRLYLS